MAKIYYDKDADLNVYKGRTIAIVGYGIQGRGQALSLRDSGLNVLVAQRPGGVNYDQARKDGFEPVEAGAAAKKADVIMILTQDHAQGELYRKSIKRHLKKGKSLAFSHGFNIHFGQIKPPADVDVWMIAPKGPGALVRRQFEEGKGVPCLVAIHQNASGNALKVVFPCSWYPLTNPTMSTYPKVTGLASPMPRPWMAMYARIPSRPSSGKSAVRMR